MTRVSNDFEQYFAERLPHMVAAVQRLVEFESPSLDVPALNRAADALNSHIMSMLGQSALTLRSGPERRPHLRVDLGDRTDILMIGHFDTVHPLGTISENPARVEDGRIYGPGALDMKGGIVSMIEIARRLQMDDPRPNVTLFFNSDEEIASVGSGPLLREIAARARVVLVFDFADPTRELRNGARGVRHVEVSVHGKGGHAAYPERNRNPLEGLAKIITAAAAEEDVNAGLSISPTRVGGSEVNNVVSDVASAIFDVRGDSHAHLQAAEKFFLNIDLSQEGFDVEVNVITSIEPFPVSNKNQAAATAQLAAHKLGWPALTFKTERGASDANQVAPVTESILVGFGGWGDGAHSAQREYLEVESMHYFSTLAATIAELTLSGAQIDIADDEAS